ncbi:MAG: hypothetical protein KKE93_01850 [Nanoarchaeota archaeon]|nr:hypothetical protein [Nanoarchaeota archaeon]
MDLDAIVLAKPEAYETLDKSAAEGYFKAEQRVLSAIKAGLIDIGEEQLKAKTGFTSENLPDESPKRTEFSLDGIDFGLITNVKVINPPYQTAFDKITGFLEVLVNDRKQGIRKDNVKTYDKKPFVEMNYLMRNALWYLSIVTELGVENKFERIAAPAEIDKADLERLVIPVELMQDFDIEKPGAAKLWYQARRFYDDVIATAVAPLKDEMVKRTGVTIEEMPDETQKYWEQLGEYLFVVQSIPSTRREPGKVINRLYMIPQKTKPKGSTTLPVVPGPENYLQLLEDYRAILPTSLKKWKYTKGEKKGEYNYEGKIGELVIFYYGIENDPRIQDQFPFLPEFQLKRDGDKMFVSIQALYDRMKALEKDYVASRLLRVHSVVPIV